VKGFLGSIFIGLNRVMNSEVGRGTNAQRFNNTRVSNIYATELFSSWTHAAGQYSPPVIQEGFRHNVMVRPHTTSQCAKIEESGKDGLLLLNRCEFLPRLEPLFSTCHQNGGNCSDCPHFVRCQGKSAQHTSRMRALL